jgi:hypothetical protein
MKSHPASPGGCDLFTGGNLCSGKSQTANFSLSEYEKNFGNATFFLKEPFSGNFD